mmetsp:Transcript_17380/g.24152  ORF Transcript_17380/g.24152 Transcript_17380/m.24152 type:complete len:88 (+) Transcript_17380:338-601(+)
MIPTIKASAYSCVLCASFSPTIRLSKAFLRLCAVIYVMHFLLRFVREGHFVDCSNWTTFQCSLTTKMSKEQEQESQIKVVCFSLFDV